MATVLVKFEVDGVSIVTGEIPPDGQTPISDPVQTGHVTNRVFIVAAGTYCYGLLTPLAYAPLWQVVEAVDGVPTTVTFRRIGS